jgi:hypothetical protein|tara:strand:+ start:582 stop:770 length:189 start_codon:yes stop_codon:yes gene_type:complete
MTREERIEEMLHHAHERGYYNEVLIKANKLKNKEPKLSHYDLWEQAYQTTKSEFYENRHTGE